MKKAVLVLICNISLGGAGVAANTQEEAIFKSSEFLKWKRSSQEFYLDATIGMAGLIASQNDKEQGKCIDSWYIDDHAAAIDYILDTMRRAPDYHPRGVIAAVIEKKCGDLRYKLK